MTTELMNFVWTEIDDDDDSDVYRIRNAAH